MHDAIYLHCVVVETLAPTITIWYPHVASILTGQLWREPRSAAAAAVAARVYESQREEIISSSSRSFCKWVFWYT